MEGERWWNRWVHQDINTKSNSQEDQELTPAGRGYRNRCGDGDSWLLPFVLHLHMLESFLSTTSFCSSQWFEVFLLTVFWTFIICHFFLLYTAWIFFVSSVLLLFWPSFLCCLFLHKFLLVAAHYIKYCRNRMFL